ncbi:hypothetical protein [Burkholderia gladioli]|uniref:hypothetical protein n=1 Tax=Burkholderia gladioli TaxID=28095 RepID=UPI001FC866D0|nr:hypothetical protein [Burkholderia gladioli]
MLLNVVEITYLLASSEEREAVSIARFRQAEAALEARLEQIGEGGGAMIDAIEREAIEYVSTLHDQQLLGVPSHRYLEAQERVKQLAQAGQSAIPDLAQ